MCPICMEDLLPDRPKTNNNNNTNIDIDTTVEVGESSTLRHRGKNSEAHNKPQKTQQDREMKSKLLFCGHKFHKKCINDWLVRYSCTSFFCLFLFYVLFNYYFENYYDYLFIFLPFFFNFNRNDTCPVCRRQRPTEPDAPQVPRYKRKKAKKKK